ncbi:MAG: UDP-N-acetylmuramate--L-alanine ligase [Anaerolineae bacterium]
MAQLLRFTSGQHIHLIGIAGAGLSAIARVLILRGYYVSGSDLRADANTAQLQALGATVHQGHDERFVQGADLVIRSSAVKDDHPEVRSAHALGIPVYKRSDVMGALMADKQGIAIAGTHGKTTTTSMIAHILITCGHDPDYIVGGVLANTGTNAGMGAGQAFVIEADEYDNMFHGLNPQIALVTSVEFDHPDFFPTPDDLQASFAQFIARLPDDGLLIACADDPVALEFAKGRRQASKPVITYGFSAVADWQVVNLRYEDEHTRCEVITDGQERGTLVLTIPGKYNIQNALGALIVADQQGVPFADAIASLANFHGTGRRFDVRATIGDVVIVDDYAHHPTAIRVMLEGARQRYPQHTLWAVWQPHTFTRTQALWHDYLHAFADADHLLITPIYPARERAEDFPDVHLPDFMQALTHPDAHYLLDFDAIVEHLCQQVRPPALILIMSAGDAPQIGIRYAQQLEANRS